jgi:hypothetical protein
MTELEKAAIMWWRGFRPIEWTLDKHLGAPAINTISDRNRRLALKAAKLARKMRRKK